MSAANTDPPTLTHAIITAVNSDEFMTEWRRLTGTSLGRDRRPLERLIDEACGAPGVAESEARALYEFVRDYLFRPAVESWFADAKQPPSDEWMRATDGGIAFAAVMARP